MPKFVDGKIHRLEIPVAYTGEQQKNFSRSPTSFSGSLFPSGVATSMRTQQQTGGLKLYKTPC